MPFDYTFPFDFDGPFHVVPFYRRPYTFEVRDADGGLVRIITEQVGDPRTFASIRQPSSITLTVSTQSGAAAALRGSNEIWVRDQEEGIFGKFVISRWEESNSAAGPMVGVTAFDYLAQLASEYAFGYSATDTRIDEIIAALFALQINSHALTVGTIDPLIAEQTRTLAVSENDSILHLINVIEETLAEPSMFWVDSDRAFNWSLLSSFTATGAQIRVGNNVNGIRREVDVAMQATRLYAYGALVEGQRVKISDSDDHTLDYVEAAGAVWPYGKQIIINHEDVAIDAANGSPGVADFAFRFEKSSEADLAAHTTGSGSAVDIAFFDADGVVLTHEMETYTAATGAIKAWVLIDELSATVDTVIYMRFGSGSGGWSGTVNHATGGKSAAWVTTYNSNNTDPGSFYSLGPIVSAPSAKTAVEYAHGITDPDALYDWAVRKIAEIGLPVVRYAVDFADFSTSLVGSDQTENLKLVLGSLRHVIDPELGIDTNEYIVSIERNLNDPKDTRLDLSETRRGLAEEIAAIIETQTEQGNDYTTDLNADSIVIDDDTNLDDLLYPDTADWDAEDVRITDTATLDDWVYAGTDYIDGGQIQDGTMWRPEFGEITADVSGGVQEYQVRLLVNPTKAATATIINCLVPDDTADSLSVGDSVLVFVAPEAAVSAGEKSIIVVGPSGAGGASTCGRGWDYNSWINKAQ